MSEARRDVSTREGYDLWAAVYDGEGNPLVELEQPRMDAAVGDVRGKEVLDLGCGTGRHALRLAAAGAVVSAVDFSEGMLGEARRKAGARGLPIKFVQHDLARRLPFQDGAFELTVCGLVLDHVRDVGALFAEMGRVTRGRIIVSIMHPAMMLRGVQARFTDPASGLKTYPASVPNSISDYVMGALGAGLTIWSMTEHVCDEGLGARVPRAQQYAGWPMLLMMELR